MKNLLFRQEVINKQSQHHFGNVFLVAPLNFWLITALITSIIAGLICIAIFGDYARKERVVGALVPDQGLVKIIPQKAGIYETIFVQSGDFVESGQPLIKIKDDTALSDGHSISLALLESMKAEKHNLTSQLNIIHKQYTLNRSRLGNQKKELLTEAKRILKQIDIQSRSVDLENDMFTQKKQLADSGAVPTIEVSLQEIQLLEAMQDLKSLTNAHKKILANIKDIEAEISLLPVEQEQTESDLKNHISALEQTIIRTDAGGSSIIRAPVNGKIATVIARRGQLALPQQAAIFILPHNSKLQAELFVPTRAAGFFKKGQAVRLLYDAFPYQKFGFYKGHIKEISKTVITSTDLAIAPEFSEPVFLVIVEIANQAIEIKGELFPLQSGMSLSADIILEDRKIWEWIFEPLIRALR